MSLKDAAKKMSPAARIQELEALVERQQAQIERMRSAKFVLPTGKVNVGKGKAFTRVLIPDTHGAHIDKSAARAFLNDLDLLRPAEVIFMGDHLDCGGLLAQHHVLGTVPETETTNEQDEAAANILLDEVERRTPGAKKQFIEGNHEARIEKWIIKVTLGKPDMAKKMRGMYGPELVLGLEKRGIRFIKRSKTYDGLKIPGTIDLGNCLARHGKHCGSTAAQRTVSQFGCNIAIAHTHRMLLGSKETARGIAYGWCFGCLCKLQPLYYDTDPTDWAHGYGIQVVKPGSGFITLQIPILDGKSYLAPLVSELRL
jgi:hypothetical protein